MLAPPDSVFSNLLEKKKTLFPSKFGPPLLSNLRVVINQHSQETIPEHHDINLSFHLLKLFSHRLLGVQYIFSFL